MTFEMFRTFLLLLALLLMTRPGTPLAQPASTPGIESFTPQGEVARIRQVTARFIEAIIEFGDPRAADPFDIDCAEPGQGRWIDARNWSYDFRRDLPVGVRCTFRLKSPLRSVNGTLLPVQSFTLGTGGPKVLQSRPFQGSGSIREDQVFILYLNG